VSGNRSGITLFGQSYATLQKNQIHDNQLTGLAFLEDASGIARENTLRANLWNGIVVGDNASARLERNLLENNALRGILYEEKGTGSATGNTISGSKVGIHFAGEGNPTLDDNTLSGNEQDTYQGPLED
jgi:parallel beta-helix repeat protein